MKQLERMGDSSKNPNENLPEVIEKLNDKYSILERGAMKYIVNSQKKVVSKGYHEFQVFKHEGIMGLIGKTGSMSKVLKMPENDEGFFEESPTDFHDLSFDDELGLLISRTGAMSFIIDMYSGNKISGGYHEIFKRGGKLFGRTGAREEEINLSVAKKRIENRRLIEQK